jgi:hypothetical protein
MSIILTIALKLSLAFFFLRVLTAPWERRVAHFVMGFSVLCCVISFFIMLFSCGSPAHYASNTFKNKCIGWPLHQAVFYLQTIATVVCDVILVGLPLWSLRRLLSMSVKARLSIAFIFLLATRYGHLRIDLNILKDISGTICSLLRIIYIKDGAPNKNPGKLALEIISVPHNWSGDSLTGLQFARERSRAPTLFLSLESLSSPDAWQPSVRFLENRQYSYHQSRVNGLKPDPLQTTL